MDQYSGIVVQEATFIWIEIIAIYLFQCELLANNCTYLRLILLSCRESTLKCADEIKQPEFLEKVPPDVNLMTLR